MSRLRRTASLLFVSAFVVAGCGDDTTGSDEPPIEQAAVSGNDSIEGRWVLESWEEAGAGDRRPRR